MNRGKRDHLRRRPTLGVPLWWRGLCTVVIVLITLGTLALNTLRWVPHSGRVFATLASLWLFGLLALLLLARRWRARASAQR